MADSLRLPFLEESGEFISICGPYGNPAHVLITHQNILDDFCFLPSHSLLPIPNLFML